MGWGTRERVLMAVALAAALTSLLAPAAASAASCRDKPGRRFDVKLSGKDDYQGDFVSGHYAESHSWSAKYKHARTTITRCDGKLYRITLDSSNGTIKTSTNYHEPDIITDPQPCNSDFLCPRGAHAAATQKGCRFKHSGKYKARFSLSAYFGNRPSVVINGGPDDPDLDKEEKAAQRSACGDTFRFGTLGVPAFTSDGLKWDIGSYFFSATADAIPALVRSLAAGKGGAAGAPATTRKEVSSDGKSTEQTTVSAGLTIGDGGGLRNRFPDGF